MLRGAGVFLVLAALYYYFVFRRMSVPMELDDFRKLSPEHYERIVTAIARFDEERAGKQDIHALEAHRSTIIGNMYELKFRLPNDGKAQAALQKLIDEQSRSLENDIQRIRKDVGKPLEFPYPMENYFMHLEPLILKQDQGQFPTYSSFS